jgi:uncharacterized protein with HEPN domain
MLRDDATLVDIVHAARRALDFTAGMARDEFAHDVKTQSATLHQLLVIGEAVKRLSAEFRAAHPSTPWGLIAGMRDKLVHAYDEIDLDEVWRTVTIDIPKLLAQLKPLVPDDRET